MAVGWSCDGAGSLSSGSLPLAIGWSRSRSGSPSPGSPSRSGAPSSIVWPLRRCWSRTGVGSPLSVVGWCGAGYGSASLAGSSGRSGFPFSIAWWLRTGSGSLSSITGSPVCLALLWYVPLAARATPPFLGVTNGDVDFLPGFRMITGSSDLGAVAVPVGVAVRLTSIAPLSVLRGRVRL